MNKKTTITIAVLVIIIALSGYFYVNSRNQQEGTNAGPNSAEGAPTGSLHNLPVPAGVAAARKQLAQTLNIAENLVVVTTAFEKEWSDSCLGLGGPAESCLMAITPGYEVTMTAQGKTYVYRTNTEGTAIREQK